MAEVATPPAAEAAQGKQQVVKPEKPDDDKYKEDLAKAEKEHTAAQEKLVGTFPFRVRSLSRCLNLAQWGGRSLVLCILPSGACTQAISVRC